MTLVRLSACLPISALTLVICSEMLLNLNMIVKFNRVSPSENVTCIEFGVHFEIGIGKIKYIITII